ncbi:MAG TPA: ribonuclease HII [Patescibacteria group bacterium]|nr:ribonuclease HII [Patescibacteria group bacterium]
MTFQEITQYERKLYNQGVKLIAGVDEVGRGPLAGPFVVSSVILNLEKIFSKDFQRDVEESWGRVVSYKYFMENTGKNEELNTEVTTRETSRNNDVLLRHTEKKETTLYGKIRDSKKLSPKTREILSEFIKKEAISYSIEVFGPEEVDKLGISKLTQMAFFQAIQRLKVKPQYVLTDTFEVVKITKQNQKNIVNGDNKSISIASASIVAKVFRDSIMIKMHEKYPNYGFDKNKGYGTAIHLKALKEFGPCEIHRKSFEPIKSLEISR